MTVYQITVNGGYRYFDGIFKCSSKNVYKSYPQQKDIIEFLDKCIGDNMYDLDKNKPYEVKVVELNLV